MFILLCVWNVSLTPNATVCNQAKESRFILKIIHKRKKIYPNRFIFTTQFVSSGCLINEMVFFISGTNNKHREENIPTSFTKLNNWSDIGTKSKEIWMKMPN